MTQNSKFSVEAEAIDTLCDQQLVIEKRALEEAKKALKTGTTDIERFLSTLENTSGIDQKKIVLWRQIYEMAQKDRAFAEIMYTNLFYQMGSTDITKHSIYGPIISKYLERMNKTTDQLLKLAELIAGEMEKLEVVDSDDVFNQINQAK